MEILIVGGPKNGAVAKINDNAEVATFIVPPGGSLTTGTVIDLKIYKDVGWWTPGGQFKLVNAVFWPDAYDLEAVNE